VGHSGGRVQPLPLAGQAEQAGLAARARREAQRAPGIVAHQRLTHPRHHLAVELAALACGRRCFLGEWGGVWGKGGNPDGPAAGGVVGDSSGTAPHQRAGLWEVLHQRAEGCTVAGGTPAPGQPAHPPVRGSAVCSTNAYWAGTTCCSSTAMNRSGTGTGGQGGRKKCVCVFVGGGSRADEHAGREQPGARQVRVTRLPAATRAHRASASGATQARRLTAVGHALRAAAQPRAVVPLAGPHAADGPPGGLPARAALRPLLRGGDEAGVGRRRRHRVGKAGRGAQVGGDQAAQGGQRLGHLASSGGGAGLRRRDAGTGAQPGVER
jgi:hypothetical protein